MAQGTYTVNTEPAKGREYTNKHDTDLTVWRIGLKGAESAAPDGLFELHKKKAPPQKGEQIEVERTVEGEWDGDRFTRLFLVDTYQQKQGGGGGGSSGGKQQGDGPGLRWESKPFERGAEHPRNEKRAIHTSALSSAPAYYELLRTEGVWDQAQSEEDVFKRCRRLVAWLEKTYQLDEPLPQMEIPADTTGLNHSAPVADDVPFS